MTVSVLILNNKTGQEIIELKIYLDSSLPQPFSEWKYKIISELRFEYSIHVETNEIVQMKVRSSQNMDEVGISYVKGDAIVAPPTENGRISVRLSSAKGKELQEKVQFKCQRQDAIRNLNNVFSQLVELGIIKEDDNFRFSEEGCVGSQISVFAKRRMLDELDRAIKAIFPTVNSHQEFSGNACANAGPASEWRGFVLRLTAQDGSDLNKHLNFEQLFNYFVRKNNPESKLRLEDVKIREERARREELEKKRLAERRERRAVAKLAHLHTLNRAIHEDAALALTMLDDDDMPVDGMLISTSDSDYNDSATAPLLRAICPPAEPQVRTTDSERALITRKLIANGAEFLMYYNHDGYGWFTYRIFAPTSMIPPLSEPRAVLLAAYFTRRANGNDLKPFIRNELGLAIPSLPPDATNGSGPRGIIADYLPPVVLPTFNSELVERFWRLTESQDSALREMGRACLEYLQGKPEDEIKISNETRALFKLPPAPIAASIPAVVQSSSGGDSKARVEGVEAAKTLRVFNFGNSSWRQGKNQDQRKASGKALTFGYQPGLGSFTSAAATATARAADAAATGVAAAPAPTVPRKEASK